MDQAVADIVAGASTITERLGGSFDPVAAAGADAINARMEAWCQAVAKGDWSQFHHRLAWDGYDVETVRPALGRVRLRGDAPPPGWTKVLQEVMELAPGASQALEQGEGSFLSAEDPRPFEDILAPFVLVARRRLAELAQRSYDLLSREAHAALERDLLRTLTAYAAETLYLEFSIVRARKQSSLDRLLLQAQPDQERSLYREFVDGLLSAGMLPLFQGYPVLARLLATVTTLWIEANVEVLGRLAEDLPELARAFGGGCDLGQVSALRPSLSDPHRGRRSVLLLTFACGRSVVYKPKDLSTEEAYRRLLDWLNQQGAPLPFALLTVVNRSTHGWVECVEHRPCQDSAEVRRYYQRAGMLLCLFYALEVTDGHRENLIASGEHPVLVDMETLLQHRGVIEDEDPEGRAHILAQEQLENSVLRVGLLPTWNVHKDQAVAYEMSGLGGVDEQEVPFQRPDWEGVNTDVMTLGYKTARMTPGANVARLHGTPLRLDEHVDDLVAGFQQMYRFLMDQRAALLAPHSPLQELARQRVRYIFRATRVYLAIQKQLLAPQYLRDGADWGIGLELLTRAAMPQSVPSRTTGRASIFWPVYAAERRAMEQGDVPFFTAQPDSDSLVVDGQVIEHCFQEPSVARAASRLKALGEADLERQIGFIRGSVYALVARDAAAVARVGGAETGMEAATARPLDAEDLVAAAVAIAEGVQAHALRAADGSAAWIVPHYLPQAQRYQLTPAGLELYDGAPGIALFLAAVARITGDGAYRDLALGAVHPLRRELVHLGDRAGRYLGIGAAVGLGSLVYMLVRLADLVDAPDLVDDARRVATLLTWERIAEDTSLDVIAGSGGAILGLLALYELGRDAGVLDRAIACGRHLLRTRTAASSGYCAWATLDGKLLTGFSHGAAGIAYALVRLYAASGEEDFREAAREAIAYEDSVFVPEAGNWPDLRQEEPSCMTSWCHGAPGIGLARLGGLAALATDQIQQDIAVAMRTTQQFGLRGVESLCCGALGRADVLLSAGVRLSRPDLVEAARTLAAQVVRRAEQRGTYLLHPLLPDDVYSPGFFQGTTGVGYMLLRLAYPERLRSVLLWQ
jgi:type 2 lantibiotic biosynthesis protein LanM